MSSKRIKSKIKFAQQWQSFNDLVMESDEKRLISMMQIIRSELKYKNATQN
jgi:hypothetical protein